LSLIKDEKGRVIGVEDGARVSQSLIEDIFRDMWQRIEKLELEKEARDLKIIEKHFSK
jgi:hypothetical protein